MVAEGGLPGGTARMARCSSRRRRTPTATHDVFGRETEYVLETAIRTAFALMRAAKVDHHGSLVF